MFIRLPSLGGFSVNLRNVMIILPNVIQISLQVMRRESGKSKQNTNFVAEEKKKDFSHFLIINSH